MKTFLIILVAVFYVACGDAHEGDSYYNTYCYDSPGVAVDAAMSMAAEAEEDGGDVEDNRLDLGAETVTIVTCGGTLVEVRDNTIDGEFDIEPETNLGINIPDVL